MAVAHVTHTSGPGIDLYYEFHGVEDGARVLNISGTGADLRRAFADRSPLNKAFRVLSYDQRGLGQSGRPDGTYTMEQYADDAAALLEHAGWDRCHVIGASFGGMVALNLAVRHPRLIDRLVLNCTSPGGAHPSHPLHEMGNLDPETAFAQRMLLNDARWDPDADEPIPGLGPFYDVMVERARITPSPDELNGLVRQIGARGGHDVESDLATIAHETLVCAGEYDLMAPMANSELLAEAMPNARLAVFNGGHFFPLQDRTVYPMMMSFLADGHQPNQQETL
jgi:3-oxoadipate enol-lactonase